MTDSLDLPFASRSVLSPHHLIATCSATGPRDQKSRLTRCVGCCHVERSRGNFGLRRRCESGGMFEIFFVEPSFPSFSLGLNSLRKRGFQPFLTHILFFVFRFSFLILILILVLILMTHHLTLSLTAMTFLCTCTGPRPTNHLPRTSGRSPPRP